MCELSRPCPPTWAAAHTTPANGLVLIGSRMPTAGSTIAQQLHFAHDGTYMLSADSAATEAEAKVYYPTNASLFSKTMWKTDLATGCNGGGYSALTPPSEAPLAISGERTAPTSRSPPLSTSPSTRGGQPDGINVTHYDNLAGYLVGQNFGPGSYNHGL